MELYSRWYTGSMHISPGLDGDAKEFFVDSGNGDDDNPGVTPRKAKKSSQAAINLCVAGRGDTITRLPGGEAVTTPVLFNKSGITYRAVNYGANPQAKGEIFSIYNTTADEFAGIITERCKIEGIGFASEDSRATFFYGAALMVGNTPDDALPFGVHIKNCRFPKWGMDNRIGLALQGPTDILVEGCSFEGVGGDLEAGIYLQGAAQNVNIFNNIFRECTYAIEFGAFAGGGPECIIKGNIMQDSKFLSVPAAGALTGSLLDNWSPYATDGTTYSDTVNALQALGLVFSGNHYATA